MASTEDSPLKGRRMMIKEQKTPNCKSTIKLVTKYHRYSNLKVTEDGQ